MLVYFSYVVLQSLEGFGGADILQWDTQLWAFCANTSRTHYRWRADEGLFTCCDFLHTHTHPFNGPFSGTTQVSQYRKGKTNLDFTEARDSEWQWHQLGHMQVCTSLQTDNHASTPPLSFHRPDALPASQPTVSKHWRHIVHCDFLVSINCWMPAGVAVLLACLAFYSPYYFISCYLESAQVQLLCNNEVKVCFWLVLLTNSVCFVSIAGWRTITQEQHTHIHSEDLKTFKKNSIPLSNGLWIIKRVATRTRRGRYSWA